jgi:hypothetical protein
MSYKQVSGEAKEMIIGISRTILGETMIGRPGTYETLEVATGQLTTEILKQLKKWEKYGMRIRISSTYY